MKSKSVAQKLSRMGYEVVEKDGVYTATKKNAKSVISFKSVNGIVDAVEAKRATDKAANPCVTVAAAVRYIQNKLLTWEKARLEGHRRREARLIEIAVQA